ncbi:glycoside hydrolase family protein [Aeromonas hydrophila]|uniref:glycoside hydrolase family protein n=1 Tax=Aeromonas hydrophila TaxID=644 RepID=UPI00214DA3FE|nr:glycoside hydrolase family protein [Aeromonas hydrophila]MCR3907542.1 glycoside hydrolase family protein [Aeromonas hydrophila]
MKNLSIEEQLMIDEGYKLTVYRDTEGFYTVGIGHLIKRDSTISKPHAIALLEQELKTVLTPEGRITPSECSYLFKKDLALVQKGIESSSFGAVYRGLDPVRQSAIQNMCFQLGTAGVSAFKKMWAAISKGDYEQAYKEGLNSKWFRQTPNRSKRVMQILRTGSTGHYPT